MTRITQPKRAERKPLFAQGPMAVSGELDPNFEHRFVNDIGSRITNFKKAGYEFVEDPEITVGDSRVFDPSDATSAKVVTSNDGTKTYLMRIPKEYYNEDQAAKMDRLAEQEQAINKPASQGLTGSVRFSNN